MTSRIPSDDKEGKRVAAMSMDLKWDPKLLILDFRLQGAPNYLVALTGTIDGLKTFLKEEEEKQGLTVELKTVSQRIFSQSFDKKPDDWDTPKN